MVRALSCEYFPPFHLDLPKFALLPGFSFLVPGFLRAFRHGKPGVVTLLLSWDLPGGARAPVASSTGVGALRWPAKTCDVLCPEGLRLLEGPLSILWEGRSSLLIFW